MANVSSAPNNSPADTVTAGTPSPTMPILIVALTGIVLAGMDGTSKYLSGLGLPVLLVLWGRYFFHTVLTFGVYAAKTRSFRFLRARRPGLQLLRAGCLFGATSSLYFAITVMPLADATSIQFLAPVLVTALSGLFLGEHVGPRRWAAVAVAFTGVVIVAQPGASVFGWHALLPLNCALMFAIYLILTRIVRTSDEPAATTFYSTAVGALALSGVAPFIWQTPTAAEWGLMVVMGSAGALGHFLLVKAFHAAEASTLAPFTYSQVVGSIFWGYVIFSDVPSTSTLFGAAMIIGSGLYVWYRELTLRRRQG